MNGARTSRPLRWKAHTVGVGPDTALRNLSLAPAETFRAASPGDAFAEGFAIEVWLPDLDDIAEPLDKCHLLLQKAAEIEHALMVQYLYAGLSLNEAGRRDILAVSTEEMAHLMTVQNLLTLVGRGPHLLRQDFGVPSTVDERVFPFDLLLEPLSKSSLAKYVTAEAPQDSGPEQPLVDRIREIATLSTGGEALNRVGVLYTLLGVIVGTDDVVAAQAQIAGPLQAWYQAVRELSSTTLATGRTVGETYGHLADNQFDAASVARQASHELWDRSRSDSAAADHFRVHVAGTRLAALNALADIGLQGEGPSANDPRGTHFGRFFTLFKNKFGPDGNAIAQFDVKKVPAAAVIEIGHESPGGISHPDTVLVAKLADLRYALLLGFLELYFALPPDGRQFLVGWSFAEMFHLQQLGAWLVTLRRSQDAAEDIVAALPLNMPPASEQGIDARELWTISARRLSEAIAIATEIAQTAALASRTQLVEYMIAADRRKAAEAVARRGGGSVRTRFDEVRDLLDAGAGAAAPTHADAQGTMRSRFWNTSRDEFVGLDINGYGAIEPGNGAGSALVKALAHDAELPAMPRRRPKLRERDIQFIEEWIDDGCPEDPMT